MDKRFVCILLPLLLDSCSANSVGPPNDACFNMQPQHNESQPQSTAAPVTFSFADGNVTANDVIRPGQHIRVTLGYEAGSVFKGFMIQARAGEGEAGNSSAAEQQIIGTFKRQDDYRTLHCSRADDTATHNSAEDKHFVTVTWIAPDEIPDEFRFYYTIVESFMTFWVMQPSPDSLLGRTQPLPGNELYLKIHGSLMAFAWGFLIPVGMILALFYKVVWPNGHWFYIHVPVMIVGVLTVIGGVIMILLHSEWKWLNTTDLNTSHQVMGIIALTAVIINPLLGFFLLCDCCDLERRCRKVYNVVHGSIGLIFAEGFALCAMLIGAHILRDHPRNFDSETVHNIIYSVSGIVASVIVTIALYNGYHTRYHKDYPKPDVHEEDPPHSKDWWLRLLAGVGVIILLLCPVIATIYFMYNI